MPKPPEGYELTESGLLMPRPSAAFRRQPILIQTAELGLLPNTATRSIVPLAQQPAIPSDREEPIGDELPASPLAVRVFHPMAG